MGAKKRVASESEEDTPLLQRKKSKKKVKKGLYRTFVVNTPYKNSLLWNFFVQK